MLYDYREELQSVVDYDGTDCDSDGSCSNCPLKIVCEDGTDLEHLEAAKKWLKENHK